MNAMQGQAGFASDVQTQSRGAVGSVLGAAAAAETRVAEIPHQLERIERTLKGCHQGLDHLADRLEASVMRGSEAMNTGNPKHSDAPQAVASTPTGSRLQDLCTSVAILNERIQGLINRLEV